MKLSNTDIDYLKIAAIDLSNWFRASIENINTCLSDHEFVKEFENEILEDTDCNGVSNLLELKGTIKNLHDSIATYKDIEINAVGLYDIVNELGYGDEITKVDNVEGKKIEKDIQNFIQTIGGDVDANDFKVSVFIEDDDSIVISPNSRKYLNETQKLIDEINDILNTEVREGLKFPVDRITNLTSDIEDFVELYYKLNSVPAQNKIIELAQKKLYEYLK